MTEPGTENVAGESGPDVDGVSQDGETPGDARGGDTGNGAEAGAEQAPAAGGEERGANPQVAELTEALQRERAQFVNFRRRSAEEYKQATAAGKQRIVEKLLPILDDVDRAAEHGHLEDGSPLKVFADKLRDVLVGEQLEKFGAAGDAFDPELHEAIQNEATGGELVLGQVLRPGYRLGEKVVRTAMVAVTDPAPAGEAADGSAESGDV
ncbi:MAG: nucleotide exchange factor GrpE [Gordonia sp. (in: high G+C Gram-positive bacteria)]|uniref:nucleotide exchange factor GrpE n=1 Tax=Gordonia sp. (in: high G+C Gram-positive bacteria) TaxID=84139 RepID=UPI0039E60991